MQLHEFPTILDSFINTASTYIRVGVVGSHEVAGYSEAQQFSRWNDLEWGPIALIMSQNIAKAMVDIMNKSGGDSQQDGCLYKLASGIP